MALRLVLVSAVAGLGLSLPSGDDLNAWALHAQNWMNAKLAEWDTPIATEEGAFVIATEAIEPMPTEPAPAPAPVQAQAPAPAPASPSARSEVTDAAFDAVQDEMVASFAADMAPSEPGPKTLLARVEPEPEPAPASDPDEFDTVQEEIAASLADMTPSAPGPKALPTETETSLDDPVIVCDDMYASLTDDLIAEAEANEEAPPAPASSRNAQWAQAIRLTRQAAYAWANLLHGPAVVTIEP